MNKATVYLLFAATLIVASVIVVFLNGRNASNLLNLKERCTKAGQKYLKELDNFYKGSSYIVSNQDYGYSKYLNTCVVYYEDRCSPPQCESNFHNYSLVDSFHSVGEGDILVYQEDLKDQKKNVGISKIDGSGKVNSLYSSFINSLYDFQNKKNSLMNNN